MSTLKSLGFSFVFAATLAVPSVALADTPWWCNTSFGAWWGAQNCVAPANGTGGVLVYVQVTGPAPLLAPGNFTVAVSGQNPNPTTFQGSINGNPVLLNPGSYSIAVSNPQGYTASYSYGCSGNLGAGQYQLCVVTMSAPNAYPYGPVTPYTGPGSVPLACSPASQMVSLGNVARFTAMGGKGAYTWSTGDRVFQNVGPVLNVSFSTAAPQIIMVQSGTETATCAVTVTTAPGYGAPGTPAQATYTVGYTNYPTLPNTGFEPLLITLKENTVALAVVFLLIAAVPLYPYARKALTAFVR